jgi:hypothetical protein
MWNYEKENYILNTFIFLFIKLKQGKAPKQSQINFKNECYVIM